MPPTSSYPRRFGGYVLLEPLGSGGMSEVDLARRSVDDAGYVRFLVIKRIRGRLTGDAGFVRMFQDEARINAELQHENIAQVYDFGRVDDEWYLAMEYVPGMDLRRLLRLSLRQGSTLPQRVTLRILADVLQALDYAHRRVDTYGRPMNIVHRDVNPRNVMVSFRGEVKLIDFGVAKADTRAEHTQGQTIKGKFAYMAPEQIESATPADGRADLFAVGLLLQEMLEGAHPFTGLSGVQIVHRVLAGDIKPLEPPGEHPQPELLKAVWRKALAHEREHRYATARAFREAIVAAAEPLGGLATRAELADHLRSLDPSAADTVSQRLTAYRTQQAPAVPPPLPQPSQAPAPPPAPVAEASDSRSLSAVSVAPEEPAPSPRWPLLLAVGAGGAGGALALSLLLAVVVVAWPDRKPTVLPAPAPVDTPASVDPIDRPDAPIDRPDDPGPTAEPPQGAEPQPSEADSPETQPSGARSSGSPTAKAPAPSGSKATPRTPSTKRSAPASGDTPPPTAPPAEPPPAAEPPPTAEAPPAAEATPAPPAATETGFLFATSHPTNGYEVLVDGKVVGRTPLRNHALPVGSHRVEIRDPSSGRSSTHTAVITKGRPKMIHGVLQ
jgi:serine/threonine protein kinase